MTVPARWAGSRGWCVRFRSETVAIYRLVKAGRLAAALDIYRWFRPLLDLDVSTYLVQNIKLAEAIAIRSTEHVRAPRAPLSGARRIAVEKIISDAIDRRSTLAIAA